ncbi:MAG: V-type ATP synthase subunit F [Rudaea sp.]
MIQVEVVFVGDEVTAAGFRLGGARAVSVPLAQAAAAIRTAIGEMPALLLVTAEYAQALPDTELRAALLAQQPPMALIDDLRVRVNGPDLRAEIRQQLGLWSDP